MEFFELFDLTFFINFINLIINGLNIAYDLFSRAFEPLIRLTSVVVGLVNDLLVPALTNLISFFSTFWEKIAEPFQPIFDWLENLYNSLPGWLKP